MPGIGLWSATLAALAEKTVTKLTQMVDDYFEKLQMDSETPVADEVRNALMRSVLNAKVDFDGFVKSLVDKKAFYYPYQGHAAGWTGVSSSLYDLFGLFCILSLLTSTGCSLLQVPKKTSRQGSAKRHFGDYENNKHDFTTDGSYIVNMYDCVIIDTNAGRSGKDKTTPCIPFLDTGRRVRKVKVSDRDNNGVHDWEVNPTRCQRKAKTAGTGPHSNAVGCCRAQDDCPY